MHRPPVYLTTDLLNLILHLAYISHVHLAWQAVILLPFIDEVRLLDAMADCEPELT